MISVLDLSGAARRHVGGSLARGWLEGVMEEMGWQRSHLDGHARPGRDRGRHRRIDVYSGHLGDSEGVTT